MRAPVGRGYARAAPSLELHVVATARFVGFGPHDGLGSNWESRQCPRPAGTGMLRVGRLQLQHRDLRRYQRAIREVPEREGEERPARALQHVYGRRYDVLRRHHTERELGELYL